MKYLIVNADDLGICKSTNRAIVQAHREGVLTSASLMANGPAFDHAIEHAVQANPRLGIGLHLCLTSGRSVLPPSRIPNLVDASGRFRHGFVSLWRTARRWPRQVLAEVEQEFRAQFERLHSGGIPVDHVDSHRHIHMIPLVFAIVCKLVQEWGTPVMRLSRERVPPLHRFLRSLYLSPAAWPNLPKHLLLSLLGRVNRPFLNGVGTADHTFGILRSGRMDRRAIEVALHTAGVGVTEILTHPGEPAPDIDSSAAAMDARFLQRRHRATELSALLDPHLRSLIERLGFALVSFSEAFAITSATASGDAGSVAAGTFVYAFARPAGPPSGGVVRLEQPLVSDGPSTPTACPPVREGLSARSVTVGTCPLCSSMDCRPLFRLRAYEIHRCRSCGFDFNASFRGGGSSGDTFDEDYYRVRHRQAFADHIADYRRDASLPVFQARLEEIESHAGIGSVLDVGPGLGTFLRLAKERGWRTRGVEISAFAARHIRQTHEIDVFEGSVEELDSPRGTFDLITFWDSIEHVSRPRQALEAAYGLLRPGGHVLLSTDNFDCLVASAARILYHITFGTLQYPVRRVFIEPNLAYFTEDTFRRLLSAVGFSVVLFEKVEYPLEKIRLTVLERLVLRTIYLTAAVTGRQAQMFALAKKPADE